MILLDVFYISCEQDVFYSLIYGIIQFEPDKNLFESWFQQGDEFCDKM